MIAEMLSFPFLVRALAAGSLLALCAALLGVPLVLKRYSMIGDGLSHAGFGALAVAMALNAAPLTVAIPLVLLAAFLLLRLSENSKLKGDAAIALISSSALAIGVLIMSVARGTTADVYNYLFGSILAVVQADFILSLALSIIVLVMYLLCYHRIYAITFDETFARSTGIRASAYNALLALLTALVIVLGMRLMGAMLISSLLIFPPLTAMRLCKSYRGVVVTAAVLSVLCFALGLVLSFALDTPSGATVVAVNLVAFLGFSAIEAIRKRWG